MCFSVKIDKDIKRLASIFKALPDVKAFFDLKALQEYESQLSAQELKQTLGLKRVPKSSCFKTPEEDGLVYPNYFAPVIIMENGKRVIRPMRYRVRPAGSKEEIPSKYNVFNARIDALDTRKTWKSCFMKNHGVFPFNSFFEWVQDQNGNKRLINFKPNNSPTMWAPCLFDTWSSKDGKIQFSSFTIITDDPPEEVEEMGHDRCPIYLKESNFDRWLSPSNMDKASAYELLKQKEATYFLSNFSDN